MTPCLLLEPRAVPETSAGFGGSGGSGDFGRFQRLQAVPESSECSRVFGVFQRLPAQPFAPEARGKSQKLRRWVGVGRVEKTRLR